MCNKFLVILNSNIVLDQLSRVLLQTIFMKDCPFEPLRTTDENIGPYEPENEHPVVLSVTLIEYS